MTPPQVPLAPPPPPLPGGNKTNSFTSITIANLETTIRSLFNKINDPETLQKIKGILENCLKSLETKINKAETPEQNNNQQEAPKRSPPLKKAKTPPGNQPKISMEEILEQGKNLKQVNPYEKENSQISPPKPAKDPTKLDFAGKMRMFNNGAAKPQQR